MYRLLPVLVITGLLLPGLASAQDAVDADPPAHVSFVDGTAVIERDGKSDTSPVNMPLLAGDRVRTDTGRVEILFADGSTLHLDNFTTVDFQSDELVRVLDGRVRLTIGGRSRDVSYRLDAAHAWAHITQPGEYRLALMRRDGNVEVELAVLRGGAELVNDDGRTPLRAGERAFARAGAAPSYAYVFNSASWDAFDRWSEARRDYRLGLSAQYLPEPVRPYARAFDSYGSWRHEPAYGYVWYPTARAGWRPYYYGRWTTLRPYGWVWVGTDPWDWPTHHYGRWGYSAAGSWFWIPGRTWGAAWVSWAYAPGYVSWCPLGWNNRPVVQFVSVNVYRGYDPWRAWTVVPRHHFGTDFVHRRAYAGHSLDARVRGSFEFRDTAPDFRGYAVPRSAAPIRVAGSRVVGRAVPRSPGGVSTSPVYTNLDPADARVRSGAARIQVGPAAGTAVPRRRADGAAATGSVPRATSPDGVDAPARAIPRAEGERPRMVPERGVRSLPPAALERRGAASDAAGVARPRSPEDAPAYGRPVSRERPEVATSPRADAPGYRTRVPERAPDRIERPASSEPPVRAMPRGEPGDGGWGGRPRMPVERRAPESAPPAERAAPRSGPDNPPPGMMRGVPRGGYESPRSAPPAGVERQAPPPPRSSNAPRSADAPPRERAAPPARARPGGEPPSGAARRRH